MKRIIVVFSFAVIIISGPLSAVAHAGNQLCKVFHHRVELEQGQNAFLELGKIIFSFSREPVIEPVAMDEKKVGKLKKKSLFFPLTTVANDECKQTLNALSRVRGTAYKISFEMINKGIRFTIAYNPEKIGITYSLVGSASDQKKFIVTFYDKEQLNKINNSQLPVLTTACGKAKPCVIVDCGHGGEDCGAAGCLSLKEKDINLEVGTYVAASLSKRGYDVYLTRNKDVQVALDERTLIYERNKNASILVSIHSNAAENFAARGIETFFFDINNYCRQSDKNARFLSAIMHRRCFYSQLLAQHIHQSVLSYARVRQPNIIDRHVKESSLQVLVGSAIPSALIELGFLTNFNEARLFEHKQYKLLLAKGITEGIERYFAHVSGHNLST